MTSRRAFLGAGGLLAGALATSPATAQIVETGRYRVVTNLDVPLPFVGTVRPRTTGEIEASNWLIGCETLDRDFADYDAYKTFISPLGIKRLRMQGGWNKTEKVVGQYDFAWLDHIIDDAVGRGFQPWLQASYGNVLYEGGGGANLGAGLPVSPVALDAWDRWVEALVSRYRSKVFDWEVWNEPNFSDNLINTPQLTADFNVRTARIIKRIQPEARISGLALGHYNAEFVDSFFDGIARRRAFGLFNNFTYHDYAYNPDSNVADVMKIRASLDRYAPLTPLRQGENGAPSAGGVGRGALWDNPWTELTQAKWNTRRMLGNLGLDIECSVFGLVEMNYTSGPINRMNYKGILKSDSSLRVIRPKIAYYAIQNVASIFDSTLVRIRDLHHRHDLAGVAPGGHGYSLSTDRDVATFGYRHKQSGLDAYTLWETESIPSDTNHLRPQHIRITNAKIEEPVWVDILTGAVHEVSASSWFRDGAVSEFRGVPIYDAPIVLADRSLIPLAG